MAAAPPTVMTQAPWLAADGGVPFEVEPVPEHAKTYRSGIAFDRPRTLTGPAVKVIAPPLVRAGSFAFDAACIALTSGLILGAAAWVLDVRRPRAFLAANPAALVASVLLVLTVASAYAVWFLGSIGRTPGMARFGLHAVTLDGSALGFSGALSRWGAVLLAAIPLGLGLFFGLHDRIAGTRLVSR